MSDDDRPVQYACHGGVYVRCGQTRRRLDPGFYNVVSVGRSFGLQPKTTVSDELIDIPGTVADEIFADIDIFMSAGALYGQYGLTHKRGYLFYGPPGSGKTSLGLMLAHRFIDRVEGIVVYVGDVGDFYHGVEILRDVEPGRPSMYLIEEADALVNNTHCLSILDGELSIQGAVFVAMTNYKNRLPPRIANRPGRFDLVTHVTCPPEPVQVEYLRRIATRGQPITDDEASARAQHIVGGLRGLPMSMAHLREAFISHVLMGLPMDAVRRRFEAMAGRNPDVDPDIEAIFSSDDDDDEEEYDEAREVAVENARDWTPDD